MTPDIDLRIASMVRAMEDVVRPAIDPLNSLAAEQAALIVGHLRLLAIQWNKAESYARTCLADLDATLDGLVPSGGPATRAAAAAAVQPAGPPPTTMTSQPSFRGIVRDVNVQCVMLAKG